MLLSQSILATLAYHDIFDYPLTAKEIHNYLINKVSNFFLVTKELSNLIKFSKVSQKNNYYFLSRRSQIVSLRNQKERYSKAKLKKAHFFAEILRIIPTLKLVAISGALAMQNSHKNDDIDLVLICSKQRLWTTRLLANLLLLPYKRDPKGEKIADKACLNVIIDESYLKVNPQNLYLAHEICQMKLIWDRDRTYQKFIEANSWVKKFLPNWRPDIERLTTDDKRQRKIKALDYGLLSLVIEPLEALAKWCQLTYMAKKITTERIEKHQLFFHPQNTQQWVLNEYNNRCSKFKIIT